MKIKDLLTSPVHWTKHTLARDLNRHPPHMSGRHAVRWCLIGAAHQCYTDEKERLAVLDKIESQIGHNTIAAWNDHPERTFDDVRKLVTELNI